MDLAELVLPKIHCHAETCTYRTTCANVLDSPCFPDCNDYHGPSFRGGVPDPNSEPVHDYD